MPLLRKLALSFQQNRITLLVWAAIALVIFGIVSVNRASQARTEAALQNPNPTVRDAAVRDLVQHGRLIDALAATQDPNADPASPRNQQSNLLRENAADAVNRLAATRALSVDQALGVLFLLRKDSDTGVKSKATDGLAALGAESDANRGKIGDRLSDGDPDIRGAAADALAKIGGSKAAKDADGKLQDPAASDAAQSALTQIGAPSVPLLVAHLSSPDAAFRQRVITMLGQIASPLAVPALTRAASADAEPSVRRLALIALANTVLTDYNTLRKAQEAAQTTAADPKTRPEDTQKAKDAMTKAAAAFAQARAAEPPLVAALHNTDADSAARAQAALALGRIASPTAAAALAGALGDFDARVRQAALQGVESVGGAAQGLLLTAVAPAQPEGTRTAAAEALGRLATPPALSALSSLLSQTATPAAVRRSAVGGLGASGSASAVPMLVSSLSDPDGSVAAAASDALLTPNLEPTAVPLLVGAFAKPSPAPFLAAQTLSRMGNLAVPALEAAARASSPAAQTWAAVALGQTDSKDPGIPAALTPLTHSANQTVQYAASEALSRLSGA